MGRSELTPAQPGDEPAAGQRRAVNCAVRGAVSGAVNCAADGVLACKLPGRAAARGEPSQPRPVVTLGARAQVAGVFGGEGGVQIDRCHGELLRGHPPATFAEAGTR